MINAVTLYVIQRFEADDMVHTISLCDNGIIDVKKENIYPLVNIDFLNKTDTNESYSYLFRIHVLQQRDSNRKVKPSKLMADTNYLDNLGDCESIINRFVNYVRRFELDLNATIELTTIQKISGYGGANLDGFTFEMTLSIPNTGYCGV